MIGKDTRISGDMLDYQNIYAQKDDGTAVYPSRIRFVGDSTEVTIPYDGDALNIYIPDLDGNVMQAVLSSK